MQHRMNIWLAIVALLGLAYVSGPGALQAADDYRYTVTELEMSTSEASLLANDGAETSLQVVAWPSHGDMERENGVFRYWSDPGFVGWDSMVYRAGGVVHTLWIRVGALVVPLAGDWAGLGADQVGHYNSYTGRFYLCNAIPTGSPRRVETCVEHVPPAADPGWIPVSGDWDADGVDQVGLYDPVQQRVHLYEVDPCTGPCTNRTLSITQSYFAGAPRAMPIAGDWEGDGIDTVGFFDPDLGQVELPELHGPAETLETFPFGPAGATFAMAIACGLEGFDTVAVQDPATQTLVARDGFGATASFLAPVGDTAAWHLLSYRGAGDVADIAHYDPATHTIAFDDASNATMLNCYGPHSLMSSSGGGLQSATISPPPVEPPPREE